MDAEYVLWFVLIFIIIYLVKKIMAPPPPPVNFIPPKPIVKREYTLKELREGTGSTPNSPILICIKGKIYDVSKGSRHYGPGGSYHVFAGHEVAYSLGKTSTNPEDLDKPHDTLDASEVDTLNGWIDMLSTKYEYVGWLEGNQSS